MNILPKKSWHVRNKDNVARVRRDEVEAEEQRRKREARAVLAEQEARTEFLRKKARLSAPGGRNNSAGAVLASEGRSGHLNLFQELEKSGNKEYEEEKRREKERQEKALGILTYLGQSAAEAQTSRPWYQEMPDRSKMTAKDAKLKDKLDPLAEMERHLCKKKESHKKERKKEKGEKPQKDSLASSSALQSAPAQKPSRLSVQDLPQTKRKWTKGSVAITPSSTPSWQRREFGSPSEAILSGLLD